MTPIHYAFALVAAAAAVLVGGVSVAQLVRQRENRLLTDRLILLALAAIALAVLSGGAVALVAGRPPGDLLHVLYGALALAALPVGRYIGRSGPVRRRVGAVAGAAAVLVLIVARLFMTA